MDNCNGVEREISIREVFWSFIFNWRRIICLGIVFGILVTGFQYVRDMRNFPQKTGAENSVGDEIVEEENEDVENIRTLRREVVEYRKYYNNSPLMQIDPYNEPVVELQYRVQSDYIMNYTKDILPDYTSDILSIYSRYISSGDLRKGLIEGANLDITAKDFKELINVGRDSNMIYITIAYPEVEKLDIIAETFQKLLSEKETDFQKVGSHKLQFVEEEQYSMVNDALIDKKNTILTRIATLNVQIKQLENFLTKEEKEILDKGEEIEEGLEISQNLTHPGIRKKYMVLGVFLGMFLAAIWIGCEVLFASKLQNPEEIRSLYGECLYGEVRIINGKKKFLSIIDDKLLSIKNRKQKKLSSKQQMDVTCANVAISCKRQNIESIYITGSEYENMDASVMKLLKEKLQKQGIQVKDGENMCYNDISMKQGEEIGNILLVEQTGKSIYDEIFREIQLMKDQDMNILGVIVLV